MSIAFDGERAFFRTWDTAAKAKRLRSNPDVEIAPSTFWGRPTGPAIRARARLVGDDDVARASRALVRSHPLLHGIVVPLIHRMRGHGTVHFELLPGTAPAV